MNVWQYSRWTYLIGRSIKNKSLESSEREAFSTFINEILKTRPMLSSQLNIKKGSNALGLYEQNDYSLGKMLQIIGRNLKVLTMTEEEKKLCDRLFFSTDERRYMTYNEYQALDGKNVFVTEDENLSEIINNCTPNSIIILSEGNYEGEFNVSVDGTKIKSEDGVVIIGSLSISTNNVSIENVTIKSQEPVVIKSDEKLENIIIKGTTIESGVVIGSDVSGVTIEGSSISGEGVLFEETSDLVTINSCEINGDIVFNGSLNDIIITNNAINSEKGIVLNGQEDGNVVIEDNNFNEE